MGIIVGLCVAACFGSGDFLGGRASRDAPTPVVLFVAQLSAALGAVVLALVFAGSPIGVDLAYGAGAGLLNVIGLGLLYQGTRHRPDGRRRPDRRGGRRADPGGLGAGDRRAAGDARRGRRRGGGDRRRAHLPGDGRGRWRARLTVGRDRALRGSGARRLPGALREDGVRFRALAGALGAHRRGGRGRRRDPGRSRSEPIRLPAIPRRLAILAGVFDVGASAFLYGVRNDLTVVVAPIVALGPGFTVMLAWKLLHEPVSRVQVVGLAVALVGLALIAAG